MSGRTLLATLLLALLIPHALGGASESFAPARVVAETLDPTAALVQWTPGLVPADAYRVYGVDTNGLTLLLDTSDTPAPLVLAVLVPAGYGTYAVTGIKDGQESAPQFAWKPCIYVQVEPPGVVKDECEEKMGGPASIRRLP